MNLRIDKELFQWERDRCVFVDMSEDDNFVITYLSFYNAKSQHSHEVLVMNGRAKIPNYLMEDCLPITVVACTGPLGAIKAIGRREFKIIKRARPFDYGEIILPEEEIFVVYDGGEER